MGQRTRLVVLHATYALLFLNPLLFSYRFQSFLSLKELFCFGLLLILFVVWGISSAMRGEVPFERLLRRKPLILFLSLVILAAMISPVPHSARAQLWKILLIAWSYFLLADLAQDELARKRLLKAAAISGVVAALIGLAQKMGLLEWSILRVSQTDQKIFSTFGNVSGLAGYLVLIAPLLWGFYLSEKRWTAAKVAWAISAVLCFVVTLACETRGTWLSLVFTLGLFAFLVVRFIPKAVWLAQRKPAIIMAGACVAGLMVVLLSPSITASSEGLVKRVESSFDLSQPGVAMRVRTWLVSAEMLKARPIRGHGLASFAYLYPEFQASYFAKSSEPKPYGPNALETESVHNDYLQLLVEMGVLGLLAALILFGSLAGESVRTLRSRLTTSNGFVDLGAFCSAGAMLFYASTSFPFRIISDALVFVTVVAVLTPFAPHGEQWRVSGWRGSILALASVLVFIALGATLMEKVIREYAADYLFTRAQILQVQAEPMETVHAALERARDFDPDNSRLEAESGKICLATGRTAEGVALLQKSLGEYQSAWVHLTLARGLELSGDVGSCVKHYKAARFLAVGEPLVESESRSALMRLGG